MAVLNVALLVGNLTKDPGRLRRTPSGLAASDLRLALNLMVRSADGGIVEETCFVDVVALGRQAENAVNKLVKGSQVLVDGRLWSEEVNRGNRKQNRLSVVAERIVLLGAPKKGAAAGVTLGVAVSGASGG
ncbi:MAG: single-stranded DNA-binding protein [bacterium]